MPHRPQHPPREVALGIVRRLREHGHAAYFAGGCVRDELLDLHPTDFDVATDATPDRIRALFRRTAHVGAHFGVVLVREGRVTVEVATFRSEGPYSDRRRPDTVRFSDPRSDALRRDFTINALFLDPLEPPDSPRRVIDYIGGLADLRAGLLRAVGNPDDRLAEDHLRALRAVRLAGRLGLAIDPATAAAIHTHARELAGVSRERIGDELRKIMANSGRARAVTLLSELGLDAPALDEGPPAHGPPTVLASLDAAAAFPVCLAAWAVDRGEATDAGVVRRWRSALMLSNEEADLMGAVLGDMARVRSEWPTLGVAGRKRLAARESFAHALTLLRTSDRGLSLRVAADVEALCGSAGGLAPDAFVSGDDLIALGFRPGPAFKPMLERLYDAQLEGRLANRAAALEAARGMREGTEPGADRRV